ncbi:MAG: CDP-diacylglycerol--glycerol-3-phosphate 3-phosphatidyltransferase [Oscillospiraceae bacterium]
MFLVLMYLRFPGHTYWAFGVFVLASLSDFADGYIARHYNQVSDFGKFMDPLADKLLVVAAMLMFVEQHQMPAWALLLVVAREFAVTGLRLVAVDNGRVIAAAWSGKIKTASTMVAICLMLLWNIPWLNTVCWVVIVVTTVYSGVEYFVKNHDVFQQSRLKHKRPAGMMPAGLLGYASERECLQRLVVLRVPRGERLALDRDAHGLAVEVIEERVDQTADDT